MIANQYRGEIIATLDEREWLLCLTLGALAELEAALGENDIASLVSRFSKGQLSAKDMHLIIASGLRGGGHDICDEEVGEMRCEGALTGYAKIVAELLTATFFDASKTSEITTEEPLVNPPLPQK